MKVRGHIFTSWGSEEMLCRACGFVTGNPITPECVVVMLEDYLGEKSYCGKAHHVFISKEDYERRFGAIDETERDGLA
jgi:hypothetical protein